MDTSQIVEAVKSNAIGLALSAKALKEAEATKADYNKRIRELLAAYGGKLPAIKTEYGSVSFKESTVAPSAKTDKTVRELEFIIVTEEERQKREKAEELAEIEAQIAALSAKMAAISTTPRAIKARADLAAYIKANSTKVYSAAVTLKKDE